MGEKEKTTELHDNHKKRLREKFVEAGSFDGFYDHEILEMLLSYSIVRKNTNEIAHRLIDRFKSLSGVFEAHPEELKKTGIGERTVTLLKMQHELFRVYSQSKYKIKNKAYSSDVAVPYFKGMLFGKKEELVYLMCIDDKDRIINSRLIGKSSTGNVELEFRDILKEVLAVDARAVVVAHNHPNGILKASEEDIQTTRLLIETLERVSVKLIDHFIIANNECISVMDYIFTRKGER